MEFLVSIENELNKELQLEFNGQSTRLCRSSRHCSTLPGQPRVKLDGSHLKVYLDREHLVPELDRLASKLWLVGKAVGN